MRAIERDSFPFEFISQLAERESWRKEIHRPIYHVHKWWAKRLGSVFRGILIGAVSEGDDLRSAFYQHHLFENVTVFDPFMGSGTTLGEAHKLGFTVLGRDINPVATQAAQIAFGPMEKTALQKALVELLDRVGEQILALYKSKDSSGRKCDVLYYFWVMQTRCPDCETVVDLFSSYVVASNAYPKRKPEVQVVCPSCGDIFRAARREDIAECPSCKTTFDPDMGPAKGAKANCTACKAEFSILESIAGRRPAFRLYGKLVLTEYGAKEYLPATAEDQCSYEECCRVLQEKLQQGALDLPGLALEEGRNTNQAISYGFRSWRDFFNDRQLLALALLRRAILELPDESARRTMLLLFSGVLEFNNLFTSYKGEGTGAVRHMFAHHILKPERVPIEANVWGTSKSSGSFTGLFKSRLLRAVDYRLAPTEVNGIADKSVVCSPPFTGQVEDGWPINERPRGRGIYISCGDSANTDLPSDSIDLVVTDPPFFDNVHYSELADFFFAWHDPGQRASTTRHASEVQDANASRFAEKLQSVFKECRRILKDEGLLIFTYHHSRAEGWRALAKAILGAGFVVVNSHPVKGEMSVAAPKVQAKEPIQVDIVLVCRKLQSVREPLRSTESAVEIAKEKVQRMREAGFKLSRNDRKVILFGQLLATLKEEKAIDEVERVVAQELAYSEPRRSEAVVIS